MAERLVWFLEDIQGLSSLQFGFRRFRSTADPLLRLEHISAVFENGKFVLAIFFDLQKAYDTTWKRRVLLKLLSLGFCGHLPLFIRNLFLNRTFRVRVGDTLSPSFDQIEGVPQGSVLSVLCLALAINDIVTVVPNGVRCSLYVDDLVLYLSGSTLPSAVHQMQLTINRVANWTDSHGFRFSVEKFPYISESFPYSLLSSSIFSS